MYDCVKGMDKETTTAVETSLTSPRSPALPLSVLRAGLDPRDHGWGSWDQIRAAHPIVPAALLSVPGSGRDQRAMRRRLSLMY